MLGNKRNLSWQSEYKIKLHPLRWKMKFFGKESKKIGKGKDEKKL
jgi:hypothetical protein